MTWTIMRAATTRVCALALPLFMTGSIVGCSDLLTVPEDPTQIQDPDLNDAAGAELLRRAALLRQSYAVASGALASGLMSDEFMTDGPPVTDPSIGSDQERLDMRQSEPYEQLQNVFTGQEPYSYWQAVRAAVNVALPKLEAYAPADVRQGYMGQMLALRGFAALRLAESTCPGFPLNDLVDYKVVVSPPLTTEQALERALVDFDAALSPSADSTRILNFVRVGRARTLLDLGRFAEAAGAVAEVPTEFVYHAEYGGGTGNDENEVSPASFYWFGDGVSDREAGTGLDFVSANDPRVLLTPLDLAQDGVTPLYGVGKYPTIETPIVMASGVEARLIEAEGALQAGDITTWLTKLNELRATAITPALPDTTDPGTSDARVDLTFRERAFWLFATGSRLADLRRLVRLYGRSSESVFPSGAYWRGSAYGAATSIPFPAARETPFNPAVTGCTSR